MSTSDTFCNPQRPSSFRIRPSFPATTSASRSKSITPSREARFLDVRLRREIDNVSGMGDVHMVQKWELLRFQLPGNRSYFCTGS